MDHRADGPLAVQPGAGHADIKGINVGIQPIGQAGKQAEKGRQQALDGRRDRNPGHFIQGGQSPLAANQIYCIVHPAEQKHNPGRGSCA